MIDRNVDLDTKSDHLSYASSSANNNITLLDQSLMETIRQRQMLCIYCAVGLVKRKNEKTRNNA